MQSLNLPPFGYKFTEIDGKPHIFDVIRRKYIFLTPEEWVRQHVLHWLIQYAQYPKSLIKIESGLKYNRLAQRTDMVVYDRAAAPFLLVECKAPDVSLSQDVLAQALRYNAVLKAPYLLITNGLSHFVFAIKDGQAIPIDSLPVIGDL
ncbi:MAG: type I restriction enzyme HsdR N-terminal domain-containing protein [Spirosomaceae bacterium]|jgi:hypothetical protein|nr:type I restriction enzyme HsdR N-terminal domain-containing protein [Spirosomataceae bacterium]